MKFTEMMMAENLANADRFEPLDIQPDEMLMDAAPVEYGGEQQEMRKSMAEFGMDITPVIGDVKGAYELPDDMRMAKELVEQGYDEGDIVSMGLGGALGSLSMMGLIPFAGTAADVMKKGVKETARQRLAGQTAEALDKGLASRGRKTVSVEEAEFTGAPADKPTPKVYHGARSMQQPSQGDLSELRNQLIKFQDHYIASGSDALFDILRDKVVSKPDAIDPQVKIEDLIDLQNRRSYISLPVADRTGLVDAKEIKIEKDPNFKNIYFVKEYDADKGEVKDVLGMLSPDANGNISKDELNTTFKAISDRASGVKELPPKRTRAEKIKQEGFEPFSEFMGEVGLDSSSRGEHAELGRKMLSTSRDPLVAMKPGFGGRDVGNVVYSDLPEEAVRDLTPSSYATASMYRSPDSLPLRQPGEIGYKLPKSLHLEAEIAVTNPELLNPKLLSENPELAKKIQRGQDIVDKLVGADDIEKSADLVYGKGDMQNATFNAKYGMRRVRDMDRMKAEKLYKDTRQSLNELQSLGQFTDQYGARGTYDDVLETLVGHSLADNLINAAAEFPENSVKGNHLYGLAAVVDVMKQNLEGAGYNAAQRKFTATRGISDEVLYDAVYKGKVKDKDTLKKLEDAGIEMSPDGDPLISKYDVGYNDLKRLLFLGTEKLNRGGLAARK